MFTAVSGAVSLAILAGCATRQSGLSASDEAARYLQSARGRYVIPGPPGDPWGPYIREASQRFDVPETWIRALMRQESGGSLYRNGRLIMSSAGAMGLMQVMPETYDGLRDRYALGDDPFDPHDNIMAGVGYMREMYDMYGSPGFLAAYNAGPNRLDDYLANQRALPDETRHYVAAIGPSLRYASPRVHSPAEQFAMNQLPLSIPPGPRFGYGTSQLQTVQVATAQPTYTPPAYTPPAYTPPARAVAWAEQPKPVYAPPPPPPAPTYAPAPVQTYAPPPQRTVVARAEEREDDPPVHRSHLFTHQSSSRVTLAMARTTPQRSNGSLHLISSAVAAEPVSNHHGRRADAVPVSYRVEHAHASGAALKLHALGPVQAAPSCHKLHGKTVCGSRI
jgi:hypothetical protein